MAIVINGSGTVTGLAVGGLPDGTVDAGTLATDSVSLTEMASGTDGNIISYDASGNPVAIATGSDGQVLTSTGAGSPPAFEAVPAGGITQTDQWHITTNFTGNANPIASNWERDGTTGFGKMGSGMSVSSGHFSFPATGLYKIEFNMLSSLDGDSREVYGYITTTTNNSTWTTRTDLNSFIQRTASNATYTSAHGSCFLAVDNTTNCKARFAAFAVNTSRTIRGGSTNHTYVTFTRVGDV